MKKQNKKSPLFKKILLRKKTAWAKRDRKHIGRKIGREFRTLDSDAKNTEMYKWQLKHISDLKKQYDVAKKEHSMLANSLSE